MERQSRRSGRPRYVTLISTIPVLGQVLRPRKCSGSVAFWTWSKLDELGNTDLEIQFLEARGITRVLPEEKHDMSAMGYFQMFTLWFSINVVVNNLAVGFLGPLVFSLGWVDCVCIVIFANALSACGAAYTGSFGPASGNRTMVCCARMQNTGYDTWAWSSDWAYILLIRILVCLADTRSILDGILAVQNPMHSQCNTPGGLGYHCIDHRWTK